MENNEDEVKDLLMNGPHKELLKRPNMSRGMAVSTKRPDAVASSTGEKDDLLI